MNQSISQPKSCSIPVSANIKSGVTFGERVVLLGNGITIQTRAKLDADCIIGEGVTIGEGAWVRSGAVVLHSIPSNAIVEGNPARVVGYVNHSIGKHLPESKLIDTLDFSAAKRPSKIPLGVGESALYLMRKIEDSRGSLIVGEVPAEVPFTPARYFAVYGVPSVELRGEHAHKRCQQFLSCLHGSCRILLDDGVSRCDVLLDRPDIGVFMPEMIWGTQYFYSPDAVLLVFASRSYEYEDYLRTYDDFLRYRQNINGV